MGISYNKDTVLAAAWSTTCHFPHFNNWISFFNWTTQFKKGLILQLVFFFFKSNYTCLHLSDICTTDMQNKNFLSIFTNQGFLICTPPQKPLASEDAFYLENCRSSPYNRLNFLTAAHPPIHHFHHFNNLMFPLENQVTAKLEFNEQIAN